MMKKTFSAVMFFLFFLGFILISCSQPANGIGTAPVINTFYTVSNMFSGHVVSFPEGSDFQLFINVTDPDGDINKLVVMFTIGNNTEELLNISSATSFVPDGRFIKGTYTESFTASGTGSVAFSAYVEDWKGNKSNTAITVATFY